MPVVHAYLNPLVKWIWLGGCIVVFGTLLALAPNRRVAIALSAVPADSALSGCSCFESFGNAARRP